jgi:hypothetical protein
MSQCATCVFVEKSNDGDTRPAILAAVVLGMATGSFDKIALCDRCAEAAKRAIAAVNENVEQKNAERV